MTTGMSWISGRGPQALALNDVFNGRVFQRTKGQNSGDIQITYAYTGAPPDADGQLRLVSDNSIIVPYTPLTSRLENGGTGSGRIPGAPCIPGGQCGPYKIEIRRQDAGVISRGSNSCYVGMWILMYGQSNMGVMANQGDGTTPAANPGTGWFDVNTMAFTAVPNASGARRLLNGVNAALGLPVAALNPSVPATGIEFLVGANWDLNIVPDVAAIGGDFECIVWNQGENNTVGLPALETVYLTNLRLLQDKSCTLTGRSRAQCPVFVSSQGRLPGLNPWYAAQQRTNVDAGTLTTPHVFYSHTSVDLSISVDGHYNVAGCDTAGRRFAQSVSFFYGVGASRACWFATAGAVVDATHTDITLVHGSGTDFTPTSAITGFEVSGDGGGDGPGGTWITATGARQNANTIRLTHSSLNTTCRKFRYQTNNQSPDITGAVYDNAALPIALNYTPTPILCSAASPTPTPIKQLQETTNFDNGTLRLTVPIQRIGPAAADRLVQMLFVAGQQPTSVTVTPFNFDASASDWVGTTFAPVSMIKVVDIGGVGSLWQAVVANGNECSVLAQYASNPFGVVAWTYTVSANQLNSTTPVASSGQVVTGVSDTVPGTINVQTSSGGYVLVGAFGQPGMIFDVFGTEEYSLDHFFADPAYTPAGQQTQAAHACPTAANASSTVSVQSGNPVSPGSVKLMAVSFR